MNVNKPSPTAYRILAFLAGAGIFSLFSTWQKFSFGTPQTLFGTSIPILFGGVSGLLIAIWQQKSRINVEKRRDNDAYYRTLVEQASDGIFVANEQNNFIDVNASGCAIFGYSREEILRLNISDLLQSNSQDEPPPDFSGASTDKTADLTRQIIHKDGTFLWVKVSAKRLTDGRLHATIRNITERKKAEESIQEAHEQLIAVLDGIDAHVYAADFETFEIIFTNKKMREDFKENINGKICWQVFRNDSAPCPHCSNKFLLDASGQPTDIFTWEGMNPITKQYYLNQDRAIKWVDGRYVRLQIAFNITDRKRAEEILRESHDLAQAANRAKSAFLANMSHEIRTPLNAVIGMTGLLLDTPLTPEQQEYGQTVRSSGDALLTLINDILDFSKIEAGKLGLELHPFDLRLCVEEALDVLATRASEKGLELAYQIDPDLPAALVGDITRLRQVLVNLIGNAVKFTEKGEVAVFVTGKRITNNSTNNSTHSQHEIQFAVKDTGIGISQNGIDKLFKSFSQVDASTTRRFGGTGLGLAVSKRLVEMMGGAIWVDSEAGSGSTFHFTLMAEATASSKQISFNQIQPSLSGKRLLIVDDNETNCHILLQQTKRWGMIPEAAVSGPEALSWLDKGQWYDIAILDFQMPEMDGLALANEIRNRKNEQSPPLVMLSSVGQLKNKAYSNSIDAFLTKPVKPAQLFDILMKQFAGQPLSPIQSPPSLQIDTQIAKRHPLRILLAEDNVINQKVALRMLERIGYRADIANNGLEVIDALQKQTYDLIFMDVQMPEMDGVEATAQIRQSLPEEQQPQIIALTADALTGARDHYVAAGMDDYISKPFRMEQLISILDKS